MLDCSGRKPKLLVFSCEGSNVICFVFQMKERLSEQEKELETLKITMKAKDMELKSDGTETAKAAGEYTLYWQSSYPNLKMSLCMRKTTTKKNEFPIRSDTIRPLQSQKQATSLKMWTNFSI